MKLCPGLIKFRKDRHVLFEIIYMRHACGIWYCLILIKYGRLDLYMDDKGQTGRQYSSPPSCSKRSPRNRQAAHDLWGGPKRAEWLRCLAD